MRHSASKTSDMVIRTLPFFAVHLAFARFAAFVGKLDLPAVQFGEVRRRLPADVPRVVQRTIGEIV